MKKLDTNIMKKRFAFHVIFLAVLLGVSAIPLLPFPGWKRVEELSPDIILARCTGTPAESAQPTGGLVESGIDIEYVLKGRTNLGPARLRSMYWPCPGESYVLFAKYHDGLYDAIEKYRTIPVGFHFSTNALRQRTLDEQVHVVLKYRLNQLTQELQEKEDEKQRLNEGLANRKGTGGEKSSSR